MHDVPLSIWHFALVYILLIVVSFVMKCCGMNKVGVLFRSSLKMSLQLFLAGFVLTWIFGNPNPLFTGLYLCAMTAFAVYRVLLQAKGMGQRFEVVTALAAILSGMSILVFFVAIVANQSLLNPQYVIPIAGMIMGNVMNGCSLAIRTFRNQLAGTQGRIEALISFGCEPKEIIKAPMLEALEAALLPVINNMSSMGIVALPGMLTGQILAGAVPSEAVLYQIAILIAICCACACAIFGTLYFGGRALVEEATGSIIVPKPIAAKAAKHK